MRPSGHGSPFDATLAVCLSPLAEGRRVLWLGAPGEGVRHLESVAAGVRVSSGEAEEGFAAALSEVEEGSVDLAVAPDAPMSVSEGWVEALRRVLAPQGVAVLGWTVADGDLASIRDAARDGLGGRFPSVRLMGQAAFEAHALADLEAAPDDVTVDAALVDESAIRPARLVAICGGGTQQLDPYILVPRSGGDSGEGSRPDETEAAEVRRLEAALADRGRAVRGLQEEVERRGALVRDLVERIRDESGGHDRGADAHEAPPSRRDEPEGALERALEAEASLAEARYRIDELEARLLELDAENRAQREANLEGTIRGLRSRVAELEEMRALAEGRLELMRLDLEGAREQHRRLEREQGELREQLELEIVRSQGAQFAHQDQEEEAVRRIRALETELSQFRGERDGLRARLEDRERALEALRGAATNAGVDDEAHTAVRDERDRIQKELSQLRHDRDELVTRLQVDLAKEEESVREAEARLSRLQAENEQLRTAMLDASSAMDERDALARRVEHLEAAREQNLRALHEARDLLGTLPGGDEQRPPHEITAAGLEAPEVDGSPEELRAQIRALQERATRLQEELEHERRARRQSMDQAAATDGDAAAERDRLRETLEAREGELDRLRTSLQDEQQGLKALRGACAEARQELESLLSLATESGDPATAERIGAVLRALGRVQA